MFGSLLVGVVLGLALRYLDYPLAGEVAYWLGILAFLGIWLGTPVRLFDERDVAIEQRASQVTLSLFAAVLVVGASAARVLPLVSSYSVSAFVSGALYGYVALFVGFAVVYGWLRFRP